jgi:rod shape determining protein RodA
MFGLFITLFAIIISMARKVEDLFGRLILAGVLGMWLFQVFENVGMSCGVLPVTGIPLPFFSYGSSMMIVNLVCKGLISSVWKGHLKDKAEKVG